MKKSLIFKIGLGVFLLAFIFSPQPIFSNNHCIHISDIGPDDDINNMDLPICDEETTSSGGGSSASCSTIFEAAGADGKKIDDLFNYAFCVIISSIVPLLFAVAVAYFIWGVIKFVMNPADETKRAEGKKFMIWGIIALTVMFSIWGLVSILGNSFGIDTSIVPSLNTSN